MKISIKTRFVIQHCDKVALLNIIVRELKRQEIKNIKTEDGKINFEFKKTTYQEMVYQITIPDNGNFEIKFADKDCLAVLYNASITITTELLIIIGLILLGVLYGNFYLFILFVFFIQQVYRFIRFRTGINKMKENILNCSKE